MRIRHSIVSCDANPFYRDFWPLVSKLWKTRLGITPVLCYVDKYDDPSISRTYGQVVRYDPLDDIPLSFQTQWVRFFHATQYGQEVAVISDIDMLPLSHYYFVEQIADIDVNRYVHLNDCIDTYGHLPACYHVAKGNVFKKVLDAGESWHESCARVFSLKLGIEISLDHFGSPVYWFADEIYAAKKISEFPDQTIFLLVQREGGQNGRRIDRSNWAYSKKLLQQNYYFDAHCPRPITQYMSVINPVINGERLPYR